MKDAWRAVGERWQSQMLPRHFTRAAAANYSHQPRTARYLKYKRLGGRGVGPLARFAARLGMTVKYGGEVDNVLTGRMEAALRLPARILAYPTRATIRMIGPRYMTFRTGRASSQPDKGKELTTLTSSEKQDLSRFYQSEVLARFKRANPEPMTVRI